MSKYLKLLAVVEENYEPITGRIKEENGIWYCENVMSIKLNDDFSVADHLPVDVFIDAVLKEAKERTNE